LPETFPQNNSRCFIDLDLCSSTSSSGIWLLIWPRFCDAHKPDYT